MSRLSIDLSPSWSAHFLRVQTWEEMEAIRLTTNWPHRARVPQMRAEPDVNAGLYRQRVVVPDAAQSERWELRIGSAMLATRVWVNGALTAEHWGGYTPIAVEITPHLKRRENEIVIGVRGEDATYFDEGRSARCAIGVSGLMLDARGKARWREQFGLVEPCARFGITGEVVLVRRPRHGVDDVFVYANAELTTLEIEITHNLADRQDWAMRIVDLDGEPVGARGFSGKESQPPRTTDVLADGQFRQRFSWNSPGLTPWSPEHPQLYFLEVSPVGGSEGVWDHVRFGWRSFTIDGGDLYLNGVKTVLRGESDLFQNQGFQFYGPHGQEIAALRQEDELRAYLTAMKRDLGINAFRQHAAIGGSAVFKVADEVGLLVLNQSSVWSRGFSHYLSAGEIFLKQAEQEFAEWVRRDRNHPSVVIWGVENEMLRIGSQDPDACAFFQRLAAPIAALDPTRPRTFDGGAAVSREARIHHVHHEENYDVILRSWTRDHPLVLGEFWIGGRNAERRLTNAKEFANHAEFQTEMNRLWARKIIGARLAGVSGVMPYNFSAQILGATTRRRAKGRGWSEAWLTPSGVAIDGAARVRLRHALGPFLVEIDTRRRAFYVNGDSAVPLPIAVRNDSETSQILTVRWWLDEVLTGSESILVSVGEPTRRIVAINPGRRSVATVRVTLNCEEFGEVDATEARLHFSPRVKRTNAGLTRRIFYVSDKTVEPYIEDLVARKIEVKEWTAATEPSELDGATLVASPHAVAAMLESIRGLDVRGFVVEGPGTFPGWLGSGGIFDLRQPYAHSNHFAPIMGRELELNDLYHPSEAVLEDGDHPALARWSAECFAGFDDQEGDVLTRGVIVQPGMALQNIIGDTKNVGAGMSIDSAVSNETVASSVATFRPLLSSSRREYASLAEITVGKTRWLVNRLRLGDALGKHPWADALWEDGLRWLESAPAMAGEGEPQAEDSSISICDAASGAGGFEPSSDAQTVIIHNLGAADEAFMKALSRRIGRIERVTPSTRPNHLAVEHGGFFAGSKSAGILTEPLPFTSALAWDDASAVLGGWRLLHCDQSFEVTGHAFPWAWRSDYPKHAGFAALHLHCHGSDHLLLVESITGQDAAVNARYQVVLENVRRHERSNR